MPPDSATSDMNRMYGKVMRVSVTVSSNLPASAEKPGADTQTSKGAMAMPMAVTTNSAIASRLATWSMSVRVSSSPRLFLYSPRIGTKAWEKAPSANIRRSRLGSLKATKKASVANPAPKARAITKSRTKPRIREMRVIPLTVASARSRFMGRGFCLCRRRKAAILRSAIVGARHDSRIMRLCWAMGEKS